MGCVAIDQHHMERKGVAGEFEQFPNVGVKTTSTVTTVQCKKGRGGALQSECR